ncbi:MAG TPA: sigma-70 family RNA polymerase sigma factor [Terracidiphilus sp.]|jgi:RNA polymerase sigma-70 factor (ECF subfamily)
MQPGSQVAGLTAWREPVLKESPSGADLKSVTATNAVQDLADVERVLAGEVQAFEGIVRRWQGPLVNMAWRYCRDRGRAEELAQEAFVRAWRGLGGWRREGNFSTWLFALAANVFRTELKRFPTVNVPMDEIAERSMPAEQDSELEKKRISEAVRRAVLALPVRYREPVVLFYFHEMDVAAAARTMRLPEGTLKARLSRARELLRRRFPGLEGEFDSHPSQKTRRMEHPETTADEIARDTGKEV